jgi:hypothetical protein
MNNHDRHWHEAMTCLQKLFVILNVVKDLLFAMLLRPVKSANRSFTPFRMTNFSNVISLLVFSGFYASRMCGASYKQNSKHLIISTNNVPPYIFNKA